MAGYTTDDHLNRNPVPPRLAVGRRSVAVVALASVLLTGCSGNMARQTTATGMPGAGDAQVSADPPHRFVADAPKTDLTIADSVDHADALGCFSRPADCRVRDLRTPWDARRYLLPDGTLRAPRVSEAPR